MKTFQQYLTEAPQWQYSLFDMITSTYLRSVNYQKGNTIVVPLQNALLERHFDIKQKVAAHVASIDKIDELRKIQNKKSKHISASTEPDRGMVEGGIWGGSGAVFILRGDLLVFGGQDVWSAPTKQGTRVTTLYNINEEVDQSLSFRYYDSLWESLNKALKPAIPKLPNYDQEVEFDMSTKVPERIHVINNYLRMVVDGNIDGATSQHKRIVSNIKRQVITDWFDFWNKEFKTNNAIWKSRLFSGNSPSNAPYNEVVLSNFSIEKVIAIEDSYEDYVRNGYEPINPKNLELVPDDMELYNETIRLIVMLGD